MHRLAQGTQQSFIFGVIKGVQVVFIAQVNAPMTVGFYVRVGSSIDLMEAASGYVILAHQISEQRERALNEWRRVTGQAFPKGLKHHLLAIRKAGFEKRPSYQVHGILTSVTPSSTQRACLLAH
jgi:DNA-binding IclR family transcriptional regulator